jgi:outer membrane protein OmpA-like peptidoglycan-associated protein
MRATLLFICAAFLLASCKTTETKSQYYLKIQQNDKATQTESPKKPRKVDSDNEPLIKPKIVEFVKSTKISVHNLAQIDQQFSTLTIQEYRLEGHFLHSIGFNSSILFPFDKSNLPDISITEIDLFADLYKQNEVGKYLYIVGHTDSRGSQIYNQSLSARRSLVVASLLVRAGIPSDIIRLVPAGEIMPLASNSDEQGRATNRRVEIVTADSQELVKAFLREQNCENVDKACSSALIPVIPVKIKGSDIVISMDGKDMVSTNTPVLNDLRSLEALLSQDLDATDERFANQSERERLAKLGDDVRLPLQLPTQIRPEMSFIPEVRKLLLLPSKYHVNK